MIIDGFHHQLPDTDAAETQEWLDSLDTVIQSDGQRRARYLMAKLIAHARAQNVDVPASVSTWRICPRRRRRYVSAMLFELSRSDATVVAS